MSDYEIRRAQTDADRAAAYNLRYELYVAQQGLFQDVADHERRWLVEAVDEHAEIWVAETGGEIVGTARLHWGREAPFHREAREAFDIDAFTDIVDEAEIGIASRLLVTPEHRGGPLPILISRDMWVYAAEQGTEVILGECEPHLINKWVKFGFRPYGLCEHPINGTLVRLAFVLGDLEYVRDLDSPMIPALSAWTRPRDTARRLGDRLAQGQHVVSEMRDSEQFWSEVERAVPRTELSRHLGGLTGDELDALLGNGHALDCHAGAMLIRKGHVSRTLYVLLTGSLVVRDEGEVITEVREAGSVLGEVAFFSGGERMSDVLAGSDGARVLALSERNLRKLIETEGAGAAKFLLSLTKGLCSKLRQRSRK